MLLYNTVAVGAGELILLTDFQRIYSLEKNVEKIEIK